MVLDYLISYGRVFRTVGAAQENEIQLKGPQIQKQTQEQNKKGVGKFGWFMSKT